MKIERWTMRVLSGIHIDHKISLESFEWYRIARRYTEWIASLNVVRLLFEWIIFFPQCYQWTTTLSVVVAVLNGFVWEAIKNLLVFWSMHWYFERLFQSFNDFSPNSITMIPYRKKNETKCVFVCSFSLSVEFHFTRYFDYIAFWTLNWARTHDRSAPDCNVIDVVCRKVLIKVCRTDKMAILNGHMANKCRLHTHWTTTSLLKTSDKLCNFPTATRKKMFSPFVCIFAKGFSWTEHKPRHTEIMFNHKKPS